MPQRIDLLPTPEQAEARRKSRRDAAVERLVVTTASGRQYDADLASQDAMVRAVGALAAGETIRWRLADNTDADVPREELHEALRLAVFSTANFFTLRGS